MRSIWVLCFLTSVSFGQKDSARYADQSLDFLYAQKFLSHNTFNGGIADLSKINFGTPITFVGVGTTADLVISRNIHHDGHFAYTQILPQKVRINDSINANITGFNFAFTLFGLDFARRSSTFDAIFAVGGNTGRLKLYGDPLIRQKNPYLSPKATFIIRYVIGKICLQANSDYEFDVSKKGWQKTRSSDHAPKVSLPKTSNSGLTIRLGIGFILPDKKGSTFVNSDSEE